MPDRRYDQNELAAILRSAAEAQAQESTDGQESGGLTLNEIERVASEVGIDPKFISAAAEKLDIRPPARQLLPLTAPARVIVERHVDGDLDDDAWGEVVAEMRAKFGSVGAISQVGPSREWVGGTDTKTAHLSATQKDGGVRYRLTLNQHGKVLGWLALVLGTLFTAIITSIASEKAGLSALPIITMIFGIMAAIFLVVNIILSRWQTNNIATVEAALDRIRELTPRQNSTSLLGAKRETEDLATRLTDRA